MESDPVEGTKIGFTEVDIKYNLGNSASDHCTDYQLSPKVIHQLIPNDSSTPTGE